MQRVIEEGPDTGPLRGPLIDPVIAYRNSRGHGDGIGISVIGGHVYPGKAGERLQGQYVFGDWTSSQAQAAGVLLVSRPPTQTDRATNGLWPVAVALRLEQYVFVFGEDSEGKLYGTCLPGQNGSS